MRRTLSVHWRGTRYIPIPWELWSWMLFGVTHPLTLTPPYWSTLHATHLPTPPPNSVWLSNIVTVCTSGKNQRRNPTDWDKGKTSCRSKSKVCSCQRDGKVKKFLDRIVACVACPMKTLAGTADRARGSSMEQCAQAWVPLLLQGYTFQILAEISISG